MDTEGGSHQPLAAGSFYKHKGEMRIRVVGRRLERFRDKLRRLTRRTRSVQLENLIQEVNTYTVGGIGLPFAILFVILNLMIDHGKFLGKVFYL